MEFCVHCASEWDFKERITINSLDDLRALSARFGNKSLVINFNKVPYDRTTEEWVEMPEIIIYDSWLE